MSAGSLRTACGVVVVLCLLHLFPPLSARQRQMQIVALPAGVHALPSARKSEMQRTATPKDAQMTAGSFARECHGSCGAESLI